MPSHKYICVSVEIEKYKGWINVSINYVGANYWYTMSVWKLPILNSQKGILWTLSNFGEICQFYYILIIYMSRGRISMTDRGKCQPYNLECERETYK